MTQDEMTAAFGVRHNMHLQSVLGAQGAEALALRARLDVVEQHAAELEKQNADLTTQRDEALHMQAETMKTVEQSGQEIERLKGELDAQALDMRTRYEKLMDEHLKFADNVQKRETERRNAARRKARA